MGKCFMMLIKYHPVILYISYNIALLVDKYSLEIDSEQTPGNKILLNFDQFMKVMTNNIISTRKRLGHSNTQFESITSNVSCFICISNN